MSGTLVARTRPLPISIGIVAGILLLNVIVFLLPIDYGRLGDLAYLGVFLITLAATATIAIPIPYMPVVANVAAGAASVWLVVGLAALGSVIGESTGWYVGRFGQSAVADHRVTRWIRRVVDRPILAGVVLFVLAAPLNPVFDVAGIAAGALGMRYAVFFAAVFLGRLVRFAALALIGIGLHAG